MDDMFLARTPAKGGEAVPFSSPPGTKINFAIDSSFVDVDTLMGMQDNAMLLGSVYSPFRIDSLNARSSALDGMVASDESGIHGLESPPRHQFNSPSDKYLSISPSSDQGHFRRSARLTPTRLLRSPGTNGMGSGPAGVKPFLQFDSPARILDDHSDPDDRYRYKRPALHLEDNYDVSNDRIDPGATERMSPTLPAHLNVRPKTAGQSKPKSKRSKKKEVRPDNRTAQAPKRGEYKCGKCGFFPKKTKHDCDEVNAKRALAQGGIDTAATNTILVKTPEPQSAKPDLTPGPTPTPEPSNSGGHSGTDQIMVKFPPTLEWS